MLSVTFRNGVRPVKDNCDILLLQLPTRAEQGEETAAEASAKEDEL